MRHVYLVTYDVSDPRRLRRVYRTMRGFGQHLQLSVFVCDLTASARIQMMGKLLDAIHHLEDQVLIIDLGATDSHPIKNIETLGRPSAIRERGPVIV